MSQPLSQERITLVDALRGYALMGLFLIHMVEYFELYWYRPEPGPVNTWTFFFFGGKAYAMFALLFGVSFYIVMESQARKGVDFRARFVWRLAILLVLGLLHGLMYGGEILQILALTGLLLVPLYRRGNATIIAIALFFILQGPAWVVYAAVNGSSGLTYEQTFASSIHPVVFASYAHDGFWEVLRTNAWLGQLGKWAFMIESGRIWNIIGLSLFGFVLARAAFFTNAARYGRTYVSALVGAIALAVLLDVLRPALVGAIPGEESRWILGNIASAYFNHAMIAASLLALIVLYYRTRLAKLLQLLAPCGRMSLTIYVSQSFILVPFFYGFGVGAYAFIGQPLSLILGFVLWATQIWFAHFWFERYYYGPLEWLWRSATWLRSDIPFRKRPRQMQTSGVVPG